MSGLVLLIVAIVLLSGGYIFYGRRIERIWGIDPEKPTPALSKRDGVDYEPGDAQVVFGHHFASIAGAGPINGPIQASVFGWIPVFLWLVFGSIFMGAVHDFAAIYVSVKNEGKTIGFIVEKYVGKIGKIMFLIVSWLLCVLITSAFADIVASTFAGFAADGIVVVTNAQCASISVIFILEAVSLGLIIRYAGLGKLANTLITVGLMVLGIVLGICSPLCMSYAFWQLAIYAYILIASFAPVWVLLQPRDYINSYLLIIIIILAVAGIAFCNPLIQLDGFTAFYVEGSGYLFPVLFITVACGAVSGGHALFGTGTTSKQIRTEKHILPIGYGAMLLESILGVTALIAAASFASGEAAKSGYTTPPQIFAAGIAGVVSELGLPNDVVYVLITLSVSAFALTSLDSSARIGRMVFQEFFSQSETDDGKMDGWRRILTDKYVASIITIAVCYILTKIGYRKVWSFMGVANQLFAALALMACAIFMKSTKRKGSMLWIPMIIMTAVTVTALVQKIVQLSSAASGDNLLQLVVAVMLLLLGLGIMLQGAKALLRKEESL